MAVRIRPIPENLGIFGECPLDRTKMQCIDSRKSATYCRRRWSCPKCGYRTTTREISESAWQSLESTDQVRMRIEQVRDFLNELLNESIAAADQKLHRRKAKSKSLITKPQGATRAERKKANGA